jgi:hypothetical protein
MACITLVIPDEPDPTAAILYYNSIGFTDMATIIALIEEYARDLPPPAAVAQFYDHVTEMDLPKWLIAFDTPVKAEAFKTRKEWDRERLQTQHRAMQKNHQTGQTHQTHAEDSKQEEERRRYPKRKGQGGKVINFSFLFSYYE